MPCPSGRVGSNPTSGIHVRAIQPLEPRRGSLARASSCASGRRWTTSPATTSRPRTRCWRSRGPRAATSWGAFAGGSCPGGGPRRGGRPLINARAETLERQPAFRESFAERRCLIPADGFYEWLTDESGSGRSGSACPTAACSPSRESGRACRSDPGRRRAALVRDRHHGAERADPPDPRPDAGRPRARGRGRLARPGRRPGDLRELLGPAPDEMLVGREVGDFVNDVREDGPHLIEPREEQKSLF